VVHEQHALAGAVGPRQHIPHFESDAEARSRRVGNQHVTRFQPVDVALVDLAFAEQRFRALDVVGEQMLGEDGVAVALEDIDQRPESRDSPAIAANRTGQINLQSPAP
jgi:hypothetical protein